MKSTTVSEETRYLFVVLKVPFLAVQEGLDFEVGVWDQRPCLVEPV